MQEGYIPMEDISYDVEPTGEGKIILRVFNKKVFSHKHTYRLTEAQECLTIWEDYAQRGKPAITPKGLEDFRAAYELELEEANKDG